MPPVVTRIAPSPTGMMHIGTARTALFNWLYARHTGGKFLLRIEDTDHERSTQPAVQMIFDSMAWLGLEADETPIFQASRAERHKEAVQEMLARGSAYRCYMTVDELAEEREKARAEGRPIRSPWRDTPRDERTNATFVVRLRAPQDGETVVDDLVKGKVTFRNRELDDLILLRTDGSPTYNLAVVVDDHDMAITHVIRGDDHLSNTARQIHIYQGLGWDLPKFGHVPMIHGPDGAKLAKRHGAQSVMEFAEMGYLPETMRNYLARLGWGHGDDEIFTDEQAIAWFDVVDVVSAPARLDWAKLNHINQHYIRLADDARLAAMVTDVLVSRGAHRPKDLETRLMATIPHVKEGAKTILELADLVHFALLERPLELPEKVTAMLSEETAHRLGRLHTVLADAEDWTLVGIEATVKDFVAAEGVGFGKVGPPLRGVLSAGTTTLDIASLLASLGKTESLGRLEDALSHLR